LNLKSLKLQKEFNSIKVCLSDYNNSWYKPGGGFFKRYLWILTSFFFFENPLFISRKVKKALLILYGAKIGDGFYMHKSAKIKYPWNLEIGNNVWLGEDCWIDNLTKVLIHSNVCISQGALLLCGNHNYKKPTFDLVVKDIVLYDGVWIGARSVVCGGVTCHSHSVLSVNSVATKDLEEYSIYAGNPAVKVRGRVIE